MKMSRFTEDLDFTLLAEEMTPLSRLASILLLQFAVVRAATYRLSDSFVGSSFFDNFQWEAIADPTHGRV